MGQPTSRPVVIAAGDNITPKKRAKQLLATGKYRHLEIIDVLEDEFFPNDYSGVIAEAEKELAEGRKNALPAAIELFRMTGREQFALVRDYLHEELGLDSHDAVQIAVRARDIVDEQTQETVLKGAETPEEKQ